jgi:hypothetical protein
VINDDPPGDPWFCENPDCRSELARVVTRTHAGQPVKMLLFLVPQPGKPGREHEALVYFGTVPVKCGTGGSDKNPRVGGILGLLLRRRSPRAASAALAAAHASGTPPGA